MTGDFLAPDAETIAARIPDGARLALPTDVAGISMAVVRALVRRGARSLRLVNVPTGGFATDLLIGAGCVSEIETSGVSLAEFGPAHRFGEAVREGSIRVIDATCPAIYAELQAAEKGAPFISLRGIVGSDLLTHRSDWKTIQNPYAEDDDPVVLLPALHPDVAVIHAPMADSTGNVWTGRRAELRLLAHASKLTFVTVERIVDTDFLQDETLAPGTLPSFYVERIAVAAGATWPCGYWDEPTPVDAAHLTMYAEASRTRAGFADYLARHVFEERKAA